MAQSSYPDSVCSAPTIQPAISIQRQAAYRVRSRARRMTRPNNDDARRRWQARTCASATFVCKHGTAAARRAARSQTATSEHLINSRMVRAHLPRKGWNFRPVRDLGGAAKAHPNHHEGNYSTACIGEHWSCVDPSYGAGQEFCDLTPEQSRGCSLGAYASPRRTPPSVGQRLTNHLDLP